MARFTDQEKWKDTWFRKLSPPEKLMWLYITDNCDNAGFFELDVEMCAFVTKMKDDVVEGAVKGLNRGLIAANDANYFYVKNFLRYQKNLPLNPENNAHKQILRLISENKHRFEKHKKLFEGLISPTGKGKVKVKGKVEVYTKDFEAWWESFNRKGVKSDAFKRWKEAKDKPELSALIESTKKYIDFCKLTDRTQRDGAGYLSGKLWENDWTVKARAANQPVNTEAL